MLTTLEQERAKGAEIIPKPYKLRIDGALIDRMRESQGNLQAMLTLVADAYEYGFIRGRRCQKRHNN